MGNHSIVLAVAFAAAITLVNVSTSSAGAPPIDGRVCTKIKDLKDPAAIVYTVNPVAVATDRVGSANCTLSKLSTICWSSTIGADVAQDGFSEECCFKAKCDVKLTPNATGYQVFDQGTGAGDFIGVVSAKTTPSLVCIPCFTNLN